MIDWKKVNEELPKESCHVIVAYNAINTIHPENCYLYDSANFIKNIFGDLSRVVDTFHLDISIKFSKKNKFMNEKFNYKITHWAHINEPKK